MRRRVRWDRGTRRRPQTGRFGVGNGAKRRPHVARRTNAAHPSACVATPNTATTKKRRSMAIAHHIFRCDEKCGLVPFPVRYFRAA
jgi:ribosomal protein L37AE/L43A